MNTLSAIILAAGKGTRMKSDLPKVAHVVAGRPMVRWVVDACLEAGCSRVVLVVGYQQEVIRGIFEGFDAGDARLEFAVQAEQLGTGHAVRCAEPFFEEERRRGAGYDIFVLAGDGPLIRAETLGIIHDRHTTSRSAATLATSIIPDPSGYGRIRRHADGRFAGIVEQKNATAEELRIREVNPSYYCFEAGALFDTLARVTRDALTGEYFITDVPRMLMDEGRKVEVIDAVPPEDVLSINTPEQLAEVDRVLRSRLGRSGVRA